MKQGKMEILQQQIVDANLGVVITVCPLRRVVRVSGSIANLTDFAKNVCEKGCGNFVVDYTEMLVGRETSNSLVCRPINEGEVNCLDILK